MNKGIFLTWELWRLKGFTISEKALFIEIYNLSMLDKGCIASNYHFSEIMGIKKEAVSRLISSLQRKNIINVSIKNRNHDRVITINKMLSCDNKMLLQSITNCLESKENKTDTNKTNNKPSQYDQFIYYLKSKVSIPSKITSTKQGKELFKAIENKRQLAIDYINHQEEKQEFAKRITSFMEDYKLDKKVDVNNKDISKMRFSSLETFNNFNIVNDCKYELLEDGYIKIKGN